MVKSKSLNIESNFESLTKKTFENNYGKFNAFFSKFKNKKLIAKLFLTPIPKHSAPANAESIVKRNGKSGKGNTSVSSVSKLSASMSQVFSVSDFKKTRKLLKTYMNRKTKQKIMRLKMRKRKRELTKEKEERNKQSILKKMLNSVKLLQYLIENSNSSRLKK